MPLSPVMFPPDCAAAASGVTSRLRVSVMMNPTVLNHTVISSHRPHADLFLSVEAERRASGAPESGSEADAVSRRLHAVVRGFGGCAASHAEGTRPAHAFCAILAGRPWVVVTVPALVPCARWLGWSRELATTALVTGPVLIPFGRLHVFPPLPPPRLSCVCFLLPEATMTPHKDYCLDPGPPAPTPMLPPSPVLSEALQVCHPHAAGIDIGEAEHWVAVPPGSDPQPV